MTAFKSLAFYKVVVFSTAIIKMSTSSKNLVPLVLVGLYLNSFDGR